MVLPEITSLKQESWFSTSSVFCSKSVSCSLIHMHSEFIAELYESLKKCPLSPVIIGIAAYHGQCVKQRNEAGFSPSLCTLSPTSSYQRLYATAFHNANTDNFSKVVTLPKVPPTVPICQQTTPPSSHFPTLSHPNLPSTHVFYLSTHTSRVMSPVMTKVLLLLAVCYGAVGAVHPASRDSGESDRGSDAVAFVG